MLPINSSPHQKTRIILACEFNLLLIKVLIVELAKFIAIINNRCSGKGKHNAVNQSNLPGVFIHQLRQTRRDSLPQAEIPFGFFAVAIMDILSILLRYIYQFKAEFIVATQKSKPLACMGNYRSYLLTQCAKNWSIIFGSEGFEDLWHQRKMITGMTFVTLAKIFHHFFRFLTSLCQKQRIGSDIINHCPKKLNYHMSHGQVFAVGAFFLP